MPPRPPHPPRHKPAPPPTLADATLDLLAPHGSQPLLLALQETLGGQDRRWHALADHLVAEDGTPSPLLASLPAAQVPALLAALPVQAREVSAWEGRLSFLVLAEVGEDRCAALGREGMAEVVAWVEEEVAPADVRLLRTLPPTPLPLDPAQVREATGLALPPVMARVALWAALADVPASEEEVQELVEGALAGLEVREAPGAPAAGLEVRAGERPWLPLADLVQVARRKLAGGLKVLR